MVGTGIRQAGRQAGIVDARYGREKGIFRLSPQT